MITTNKLHAFMNNFKELTKSKGDNLAQVSRLNVTLSR